MENVPTQQRGSVRPRRRRRRSHSRTRDTVRTWTRRWRDWVTLVLGAWVFVSTWALGTFYTTAHPAATVNAWWMGGGIALFSLLAMAIPIIPGLDLIVALLGMWLVISPWVLGYASYPAQAWNDWVVGAIVFWLALWAWWVKVQQVRGARL